jgi:hypothetical protein
MRRCFPQLTELFSRLPDDRKKQGREYSTQELLMTGLNMFIFKTKSRNGMNNRRLSGYFSDNYRKLFGMKLAHQDTVNDYLRTLDNSELERVKMDLTGKLFEQKRFRRYRLFGKHYTIAVDATGVMSYDKRHCPHCMTKKSSTGKTTYFHYALEAKLVTRDGHAISLATEWIENPVGDFNKQDCERKAFPRLAATLKKHYPRLPICILADGLYPYENAFRICEDYGWKFIFVLKDESLKTVQEELTLTRIKKPATERFTAEKGWLIKREYRFHTDIEYHNKYALNWVECVETRTNTNQKGKENSSVESPPGISRFEYVTNLETNKDNIPEIACGGRLRWKIENQGFNTQKNCDYELEHKFDRMSCNGLKNYYTLLQIAHAINQLTEKENCIAEILAIRPKETIRNLWENLRGYMTYTLPECCFANPENNPQSRPAPT